MPSASPSGPVTIEEYLRSEFEPDAEYVDGQVEERPMGEYAHASWQEAILEWFWRHEAEWDLRVRPSLRLKTSPTRIRVPDVTVMRRDQPIQGDPETGVPSVYRHRDARGVLTAHAALSPQQHFLLIADLLCGEEIEEGYDPDAEPLTMLELARELGVNAGKIRQSVVDEAKAG